MNAVEDAEDVRETATRLRELQTGKVKAVSLEAPRVALGRPDALHCQARPARREGTPRRRQDRTPCPCRVRSLYVSDAVGRLGRNRV